MGGLNDGLLREFIEEMNEIPTYIKEGATYHTLKNVNWLEGELEDIREVKKKLTDEILIKLKDGVK